MAKLQLNGLKLGEGVQRMTRIAAVVLALLALWLGWSCLGQWRAEQAQHGLESLRDQTLASAGQALAAQRKQLAQRLASAPVQAALAAGDNAAAAAALAQGWNDAKQVQIVPADLDAAYAGLPKSGYARLALLESALQANTAVAESVRDGAGNALGVAAPARSADGRLRGVASAVLPLAQVTAALQQAEPPGGTYIALRHGGATLLEKGDAALAERADTLARPVAGTPLRVVAAAPDIGRGPAGLGWLGCAIAALVCAGLAVLAWVGPRLGLARRRGRDKTATDAPDAGNDELTLQEALRRAPPPPPPSIPAKAEVVAPPPTTVEVDPGIFRAYDIRGVVGRNLSVPVAELIGHAIGTVMAEQDLADIVVGRDGRLSGPDLAAGLIEGLRKAGRNVTDLGMVPTPVAYFGAYHLRTGCCVSVTGSHNPPDYNGFKIVVGAQTLSGDAITDLYQRISENRLRQDPVPGRLQQYDLSGDYIERIVGDVRLERPLKVVVDAGNGVAGEIGPRLLEAIGAEVVPLYCDIDGTFPNHHPDPSEPHNLEDLVKSVRQFDADLGLAFDGDGDRLGVVTKDGHNIFPDRLLMLFAADVLERNPGAQVIYDVKCTGKLQGWLLRHGGQPLMWRTGHSLIKAKMRETDAALAGEMSGHFFFQERWYGFDDGLYSAARLLEILAAREESPGEVLDALPDGVSTPEIKVDVPDGNPHAVVERFVDGARFEGALLSTIDGLRADWPDGWGLLRASNTTPVLVLRFEADNREALERIKLAFRGRLYTVAPDLKATF